MLDRAEAGHALSQWALGLRYATGEGVPQDHYRAYVHFSLAAALGENAAQGNRDRAAAHLSPDDLRRAQREAGELLATLPGGGS